ncbi:uncharacterized [Tachysurus ichikawai]
MWIRRPPAQGQIIILTKAGSLLCVEEFVQATNQEFMDPGRDLEKHLWKANMKGRPARPFIFYCTANLTANRMACDLKLCPGAIEVAYRS